MLIYTSRQKGRVTLEKTCQSSEQAKTWTESFRIFRKTLWTNQVPSNQGELGSCWSFRVFVRCGFRLRAIFTKIPLKHKEKNINRKKKAIL